MDWVAFSGIPNGTRVLNHEWDQCVALANLYHESVVGGTFVAVPSAYMWWTQFGNWSTLTENYTASQTPVAGAIFISRGGIYNYVDGHIGVVTSVNNDGSFNTMEQNAGTWRYVGRYTRGMADVLGFLVPKNNPATVAPAKPEVTFPERTNKKMFIVFYANAAPNDPKSKARWAVTGPGYWLELTTQAAADNIARQLGTGSAFICTSDAPWNKFKKAAK